jgi:uncharacterized membrane protein YgaE (UPF0421/DUF939 family)
MGGVVGGLIVLTLIVVVGAAFMVNYVMSNSRTTKRELDYKRAMVAIESKKAKAIASGDLFDSWQADKEAEELRQRYIGGKEAI